MMRLLTPRVRRSFLAAFATWLVAVMPAPAQMIQDPAVPCRPPGFDLSGVQAMDPAYPWSALLGPAFTIDRRPVAVVQMFNGAFQANPYAFSDWWYDHEDDAGYFGVLPFTPARDAQGQIISGNGYIMPKVIKELLDRLDRGVADGWRRFVLYVPSGYVRHSPLDPEAAPFSSSSWWAMPEWKREGLEVYLKPWIAAHAAMGVGVGVYTGYAVDNPCTICHEPNCRAHTVRVEQSVFPSCLELGNYGGDPDPDIQPPPVFEYQLPCGSLPRAVNHEPDPHSQSDAETFYLNVEPWLRVGVRDVWFDTAAAGLGTFFDWAKAPMFNGRLRAGGEAVPFVWNPVYEENTIDTFASARAPFVGTSAYFNQFLAGGNIDWFGMGTEIGYWALPPEQMLAELRVLAAHGYVLWCSLPEPNDPLGQRIQDRIKRIYSFGVINIADPDGDGLPATLADRALVAYWRTSIIAPNNPTNMSVADGRVRTSGDCVAPWWERSTMPIDLDMIEAAMNAYAVGGPVSAYMVNFGPPDPLQALLAICP